MVSLTYPGANSKLRRKFNYKGFDVKIFEYVDDTFVDIEIYKNKEIFKIIGKSLVSIEQSVLDAKKIIDDSIRRFK